MNTCETFHDEYKCYCQLKQKFCAEANNIEFRAEANDLGYCKISACINYEK